MTAIKVGSPTKIETLISRMKQSGGSTETVLANEAAAELAALRAESESRRVALEQKAEELRREWTRAENAEAALEEARAVTAKLEGVLGYVQFNCRECGGREYAEQQYASTQGDK